MSDEEDDALSDLGRRIAELRRLRGMTQAELAHEAGTSVPYIARVEQGRENLTIRSVFRFARLLGVEMPELFEKPTSKEVRRGRPSRRDP